MADKLGCPLPKKIQKRTCHAVEFQLAITGASFDDVTTERIRNQKFRKLSKSKLSGLPRKQKAKQASKKTAMAAAKVPTEAAPKQMVVKPEKVSAPQVGGKH